MKAETKAKIQKKVSAVKRWAKDNLPWMLFWTGTGAVVYGGLKSFDNTRDIRKLARQDTELAREVIDLREQRKEDLDRMLELERQQNLLFERALRESGLPFRSTPLWNASRTCFKTRRISLPGTG